ncbi:MAG: hypothetical protein KTR15_04780 [Phycisphaeraceae bacterium]|nr:hypothetical protein [Phycisphaeraceae bacterium]
MHRMIEATMNKLATLMTLIALTLPVSSLAQPDDGPHDRPDRDRSQQRERGDRSDRSGERGWSGDRDGNRSGKKRQSLSVEQVQEALDTLRAMHGDAAPPWMERFEKQAKEDPEAAAKSLSRFPRIREMMEARKHRPEEFALQSKQGQLMREVYPRVRELKQAQRDNDQAKIDELKPQIRERIEKLFQVRLQMKELEIKRIREKLAAAEQELTSIQADSDKLIDKKMEDILSGKGPRGHREGGDRGDRDERRPKPDRPERDEQ